MSDLQIKALLRFALLLKICTCGLLAMNCISFTWDERDRGLLASYGIEFYGFIRRASSPPFEKPSTGTPCPLLTWMTKLLPLIFPILYALKSSLVASTTPRPVAYSLPAEPCRCIGLPARAYLHSLVALSVYLYVFFCGRFKIAARLSCLPLNQFVLSTEEHADG